MATGYYLLDNKNPNYPQYGYPRRYGAKATGTIILHDAEGGTDLVGADMGAEAVANYIRTRPSPGSYHRLCDRDSRIRMLPIDYEAWHSIPDNPWSVGICVAWNKADLARMTYTERRSYYVPLAQEVLDVRAEFARRGITVPIDRWLTAAETQARRPGISTHSRTDPSRRSDPFGTGSVYEREFLAALAELADHPEEEDMTPQQSDKLDDVAEYVTLMRRYEVINRVKVAEDKSEKAAKHAWRASVRAERAEAKLDTLTAAFTALADAAGLDGEAITARITDALENALRGLEVTLAVPDEDEEAAK